MSHAQGASFDVSDKVQDIEIQNRKGEKLRFGTLFAEQKVVVVFVRHFFCGSCQAYVKQLANVKQDSLDQANTKIIVIGCGGPDVIDMYAEQTNFKGPIYTNQSRELYTELNLDKNLTLPGKNDVQKSYATQSLLATTVQSIWNGLTHPSLALSSGNTKQLGGDFIFEPGGKCTYASRMKNTQDHTEVADLMKSASVSYP